MQKLIKVTSAGSFKLSNGTLISCPITEPFWLEDYQIFDLIAHGCRVLEFIKGTKGNGFIPLNSTNYNTINILPDKLVDHRYDNYVLPYRSPMYSSVTDVTGTSKDVDNYDLKGLKVDAQSLLDVMKNVFEAKEGFETLKQAIEYDGDIDNVEYKDGTLYFYSSNKLVKYYKMSMSSTGTVTKDGVELPNKLVRFLGTFNKEVAYGTNSNCLDVISFKDKSVGLPNGLFVCTHECNNVQPYKIAVPNANKDLQEKLDNAEDFTEPYFDVKSPKNLELIELFGLTGIENLVLSKCWSVMFMPDITKKESEQCGVYIPQVNDGVLSWTFKKLTALNNEDMQKLVSPISIVGPEGKQGPAGKDGAPGEKGEKGDTGATGPEGKQGPAGKDGAPGAEGKQGIPGEKGEKGDTGATGSAGPEGKQGPAGRDGAQGPTGATGPAGAPGEKGEKGDTGATGPEGKQGPAGKDGKNAEAKTGTTIPNNLKPDYIGQVYVNTINAAKNESPFLYLSYGTEVGNWTALG